MKKIIHLSGFLTLLITLYFSDVHSQNQMMMHFMKDIPQSSVTNPAYMPAMSAHFNLVLPTLDFSILNNGFSMADVIRRTEDDSLALGVEGILSALHKHNLIASKFRFEPFSVGVRFDKNYISLSSAVRVNSNFSYPKELCALVLKGNGAYIGEHLNFGSMAFNATSFSEIALGYSRIINSQWTAGIRLKYIAGIGNAQLSVKRFSFYTDPDMFDLTVEAGFLANSSYYDYENVGFGRNNGYGIDAGFTYMPFNDLTFSFNLLDFGKIRWDDNLLSYESPDNSGITFPGLDLSGFYKDDFDLNDQADMWLDSLNQLFTPAEHHKRYISSLPTRLIFSGTWEYFGKNRVGVMFEGEIFDNRVLPSFGVMYQREFGRLFTLQAGWSAYHKTYTNLGLGFALNMGAFQFYMLSGNILAPILPYYAKNASLQLGFNFLIGRKKYREEIQTKELPEENENETEATPLF